MMDPSNSMDMMKKNLAMVLPQAAMMAWVSHFFSGFLLCKFDCSLRPFEFSNSDSNRSCFVLRVGFGLR